MFWLVREESEKNFENHWSRVKGQRSKSEIRTESDKTNVDAEAEHLFPLDSRASTSDKKNTIQRSVYASIIPL